MASFDWLGSSGEMAGLIKAKDWAKTPLGSPETWSPTLRMSIKFLLANRFPVLLWWGPEYVQFYNDAYIPIPGVKHPGALGQRGRDCWQEIWPVLQPLVDTPFHGGPATWIEDLQLEIRRFNFTEETHFTVAYSPVPDEAAAGGIGGVLATVHEITGTIVSARRVAILRDLGARVMEAKTTQQSCVISAKILEENAKDIPFALLYLLDAGASKARLEGVAGVEGGQDISPAVIELGNAQDGNFHWPVDEVLRTEKMVAVENIDKIFKNIPQGPWSDAPHKAVVLPIRSNKAHEYAGVVVAGISARLALDDQYVSFLELVATQIATGVGNSIAFEDERKKAEALAEIDRAKTAFFSNVSHEFRTPLTLMLGPIDELLSKGQSRLPQDAKTQLELVNRNGIRLLRLVNNLLDFSRIEAGSQQAVYEPTDLGTFTTDLASVFRSATEKAGLRLQLDCPVLAEPVFVDRTMWERIVLNLLSNAFKFTFEGEISVDLNRAGKYVELRVRDTGIGIPEKEIPRLFERFHRIENSRSRTHEGSGIGLALVQELVKAHGGSIRAESVLGAGSTFIVSVPMGDGHLPAGRISSKETQAAVSADSVAAFVEEAIRWLPDTAAGETAEKNDTEIGLQSENSFQQPRVKAEYERRPIIFVADDNADMRKYFARLLSQDYEVRTFPDGQAALDCIRRRLPDMVLTDVMMPNLDGFGLLRELRADPRTQTIPIILLSARAGEDSRVEGIDRGADDYLTKPFTSRELLARVQTHLHLARLRKQAADTLRLRTEQFETLLNNAPLGVQLVDSNFRIREANPIAREAFGNPPDLIGRKFDEVIHHFWPKEGADEITGILRYAMENGESCYVSEYSGSRYGREEKEFYEWRMNRIVLPEGGHGVVCYFRDVTRLVVARETIAESEQRLRIATEAAELGIWLWNFDDDQVVWENERPYELFGRTREDGTINGAEFRKICHPDDLNAFELAMENTLETGVRFFLQARIFRKNGAIRWLEFNGILRPRTAESPLSILGTVIDITARKQAEEALRESEERQRLALEAAQMGFWDCNVATGNELWSPRLEIMFGYEPGKALRPHSDFESRLHPDDIGRLQEVIRIAHENRSDAVGTFRVVWPNGSVRWISAFGRFIYDSDGRALRMIGVDADITERKAVEEKLRLTTERFELALRDSSIVVFNQDLDLRYTWIYNTKLGYQPWEFIGKRDTDMFERLEDAEISESIKLDVIRTGISRRQEIVIRHRNMDRYYDLLVEPLRDSNGNITGVSCAAINVTERKQGEAALFRSEYRFRTLLDSNIIPIVCSNENIVTEANDAFLQMVGYTREDLKAGKIDWVKMTPPEDIEKDLRAIEYLKNYVFAAPFEKQYIRKDGTRIPILIGIVMLSHSPEEYLCFIIDLSELKRVEADLRKYQQELEQKVSERTLELTLSLAAVGSEIKVRKETEDQLRELSGRLLRLQDEEHRRIARELHDSTGQTLSALKMSLSLLEKHTENIPQCKALLNDLNMLADSAIQEVRTTSHLLHPPLLDEIGFSAAARWYLEGFAQRSGIDTQIEFADLPDLTKDEELALFRVLQESLTNVHRHSGSTSAEVRMYAEGESVVLSIRDYGKGIPPEKLENFNKTGSGVGVGLGGMKQRLHDLGGKMEVRSEGKGITILAKLRQANQIKRPIYEGGSAGSAD